VMLAVTRPVVILSSMEVTSCLEEEANS